MTWFLDLMRRRYTCKRYDPAAAVGHAELMEVLECLRLSPSGVNTQPWRFLYAATQAGKARLEPAIPAFNLAKFRDCSAVVVICARERTSEEDIRAVIAAEDADGRFASPGAREERLAHCLRMAAADAQGGDALRHNIEQCHIALGMGLAAAAALGLDA
nr:nitroreductase family protein [Succinivibrionaceae bacterium]